MAEEIQQGDYVAPAGEPIHLPNPSYLPVIVAAGTSIALIGVVLNLVLVVIGTLVTLVAIVRWVRQTREEIAELPLEHPH